MVTQRSTNELQFRLIEARHPFLIAKLGKEKAQLVKQICLESDHFILQGLSKKEQREIISLLKQMNNTLEKEDTHGNTK